MISQRQSLNRIFAADEKGLTATVVELCEQHIQRFPNARYALMWYAMAKIDLSQYAQAEKALRRSIAQFAEGKREERLPGLRSALMKMGHLFEAKADLSKALHWYRRALRADPKYGDSYNFLGHIAFRSGRLSQAELYYRQAIACPAKALDEAYFNLGGVLLAKRLYPEAIKCYRKAIAIDPKYTIAKKRLKDALLALELKKS